jgi:hypothetical protein
VHYYINMASIVTEPNTELNSGPRFTDADTKPPQDANPVSQSNGDDGGSTGMTDNGYPEQRHAGAVGYGPSYNQDVVSIL